MSISPKELGRILLLFEKLHSLSISNEEYAELTRWKNLSSENNQLWDDFVNQKIQEDIDIVTWNSFDSLKALEKVNIILKNKRRNSMYRVAAAAAAITIILSIGIYFFIATEESKISNRFIASNNEDIMPAANKASIIFSDNKTAVLLDSAKTSIHVAKNAIVYQNGQKVSDNEEWAKVKEAILSVPRGGTYQIVLEDGTKIWLNSQTELKFPSSFAMAKFRDVELLGEAYFEVATNANKPFRVKMGEETVEVLGTTFNLSNYKSDDIARSTLVTGKISISLLGADSKMFLSPGQQSVYHKNRHKIDIVSGVDIKKELAWKNGDFIFQDEHMSSIIKQLERWYDIDITYKGNFKKNHFSGIVSRQQPLSAVLDMLSTTVKLSYQINKERKEVILYQE